MNKHEYVPGEEPGCNAWLARPGVGYMRRCGQQQESECHDTTRDTANQRGEGGTIQERRNF